VTAASQDGPTLVRGADRAVAVEALLARAGGPVGLEGMLADLGRRARPVHQQLTRLEVAFTWDDRDRGDRRWWPQGVSGSWDVTPLAAASPRTPTLLTTAYAKPVGKIRLGSRLTAHDVSAPDRVRYDHVLLVEARLRESGRLVVTPVQAHAGGLAWVGRHLHVAATTRGFHTFDPRDVVVADAVGDVGLPPHGHRYLLPLRTTYRSLTPEGSEPLRFSFLSVTHDAAAGSRLLVGEYGRKGATTRLWTHVLDTASGLPVTDGRGVARPSFLAVDGVERMQGAVVAHGVLHVVTSRGRFRRGSIWSEQDGRLVPHEYALPPGPEDVSHHPAADRLWSLTEYPYTRMVVAVDRRRFT
jgi:hypothetical protein